MYSKNSSDPSVALRHTTCYIQARLCITNFDILLNKINRPLSSFQNPHFQNEARCTAFLVKMSFICMRIKKIFPYQRLSCFPRFETEARGNSEMAF